MLRVQPGTYLILLAGVLIGCSPSPSSAPPGPPPGPPPGARPPLQPGEVLPDWQVAGWVNGEPTARGQAGPRAFVVDVWAPWCPYCGQSAPGLVEVHKDYAPRNVAFVSLTNLPEAGARAFAEKHGITWAFGYGLSRDAVAAFGAYQTAMPTPGMEIAPTLYVVDASGKVLWNDGQARYRHKGPAELVKALRAELDRALDRAE